MFNSNQQPANSTVTLATGETYIISQFSGKEGLSEDACFDISFISYHPLESTNLGKPVTVALVQDNYSRTFWGLCFSIELLECSFQNSSYTYHLTFKDPLSLLSMRLQRQIFQNMSTQQIIESVLDASSCKQYFSFSVSDSGKLHRYCVQFDETDQAFIKRLLASEGWHFHVNHSSANPGINIGDSNQRFQSIDQDMLYYLDAATGNHRLLTNWNQTSQVGVGLVSLSDYNQYAAEKVRSNDKHSSMAGQNDKMSQYLYGFGHEDKNDIEKAAKHYMAALDIEKSSSSATSTIAALNCGQKFTLNKHPLSSLNQEYLITHINHHSGASQTTGYNNRFTCIPITSTFRPMLIPKPKVYNIHTACVTGPEGKEIYSDSLGRVKVLLHWDQLGKNTENSSCWLPVSQPLASKGFGVQFTPRVGDQVLVQYIEGDPDRPVIVGALYNDKNTAPYSENTQCGIKTHTLPGGSSLQGNELRFDDKKDSEHVYIHAEKDLLIDVNNNSTETIRGEKHINSEKTITVIAKENIAYQTDKEFSVNTTGNYLAQSAQNLNLQADKDISVAATAAVTVDGNDISITGKKAITLRVGASSIEITSSDITINAAKITINGNTEVAMNATNITVSGSANTNITGTLVSINGSAKTEIKASGVVEIKGSMVMVN